MYQPPGEVFVESPLLSELHLKRHGAVQLLSRDPAGCKSRPKPGTACELVVRLQPNHYY